MGLRKSRGAATVSAVAVPWTSYPKGVKVSDAELAALPLRPHIFHGGEELHHHRTIKRGVSPERLSLMFMLPAA